MSNDLAKLAPLGGFLAAVGYCVWPYLSPSPSASASTPHLPKIEASWLKPHFGPPANRNPFLSGGAEPVRTADTGQPTIPVASSTRETTHPSTTRPANPVWSQAPDFSLGATLVSGERRAAIIDGRVYRQGDRFESDNGFWTVDWVEPGRVLLGQPSRRNPLVLELSDHLTAMNEASQAEQDSSTATTLGFGSEFSMSNARAALSEAGVNLPAPDLLQQIADQSGGNVPGAYRSLLNLLISPPQLPDLNGAGLIPQEEAAK